MSAFVRLTLVMCFLVGAFVTGVQALDVNDSTSEGVAQQQAAAEHLAQLDRVRANRAEVIAGIVATWTSAAQQNGFNVALWTQEFLAALEAAPDAQLLAIQSAADYDAVRAILQYRPAPADLEGLGIQDIGSLSEDLTFTPINPPCRIFDTRNVGGPVPGGGVRNYLVYGTALQISAQGGNPAGCSAPRGEPAGVAINVTAIPSGSQGHLRAWPYSYAMPNASYVNFSATIGNNIANAGIVSTCYLCAYDLSIYNGSPSHSCGDIMGYFYSARQALVGRNANYPTSYVLGTTCTYLINAVSITVPGPGDITVTAQARVRFFGDGVDAKNGSVFIGTTTSDCTYLNASQGYVYGFAVVPPTNSVQDTMLPVSRIFYVNAAGTYTYYLNGSSWDGTTKLMSAAMQAHYSAR